MPKKFLGKIGQAKSPHITSITLACVMYTPQSCVTHYGSCHTLHHHWYVSHTTITCHTVVHVTHHSYVSHTSHVSHTLPPMYTPQSCRTLWFISHSSPTQLCVTHCGLCHTLNHLTHCASCHTLHQLRHASHTTDMCHTLQ